MLISIVLNPLIKFYFVGPVLISERLKEVNSWVQDNQRLINSATKARLGGQILICQKT